MASPEQQTLFLSDRYCNVSLSGRDGMTGWPRNVTRDLIEIFDNAKLPRFATLRNELQIKGDATTRHPAYDIAVQKNFTLRELGGREVTIAESMRDPGGYTVPV
jgi:hypothetical protein